MSTDPVLQPFQLKSLTLKNRIMSTSHACGLGDANGMPGETYQAYHVEKARGGLALTMFGGSSYIASDSTWPTGQLNVGTDKVIPYLQTFSRRVHDEGAAIMVQITHLGRRGETNSMNWLPTIAPSRVRETGHRSIPREMDRQDIDRVVKAFGDAAVRCKEGGLDGLETMTPGHLIGQFFSPITNHRTDEFGGSLENRCRFGLMVHEEIRRRVGDDFIVGMRFGIDETIAGGQDFEDSLAIAQMFEGSGLIDFFNVNYGRIDTPLTLATDCMPGMASPIAPWLEKAGAFKREVGLPVFHAARIADIATARHAIRDGLIDMVAMTRAHIADPHIVRKIERGEETRIRPCVGASHCMGVSRPTCMHNAATGRERFWPQSIAPTSGNKRKVAVIGGGIAGMEAARVSAARGHDVVLFEAASRLGGQLLMATAALWRKDVSGMIDWREGELAVHGVDVRLNQYAEADDIFAEAPDVVIVATGGTPDPGTFEGADLCTSPWDILSKNAQPGEKVVIYDGTGRYSAVTIADVAARSGSAVELVMLDEMIAAELAYAERVIWRRGVAEQGIGTTFEHSLQSVMRSGNLLRATFASELTGQTVSLEADTVVVEAGTLPANEVFQALSNHASNGGVMDNDALVAGEPQPGLDEGGIALFRIGDAASSRNVAAAIFDALRLCSPL